MVYLDFAKAFDKVDFMVTMRKLQEMGITGKLGRWIHAFLTHRKQAILVNGARSEPTEVKDRCLDPYYFWFSLEILTEKSLKPMCPALLMIHACLWESPQ